MINFLDESGHFFHRVVSRVRASVVHCIHFSRLPNPNRIVGPNLKKRQKLDLKKNVKLTGHTYECSNLTNFSYRANVMTGKGNHVILGKLAKENS